MLVGRLFASETWRALAQCIQTQLEFLKGNFTVCETQPVFFAVVLDQAREQNNAIVKGDGGAVGLTQSPEALRCWMIAGPEVVRLTGEFEAAAEEGTTREGSNTKHHAQVKVAQTAFA